MKVLAIVGLAGCFALSACSSGPSDADLKKALQASVNTADQAVGAGFGGLLGSTKTTVKSAKKLQCIKAQDKPGYVCDVQYEAESALGSNNGNASMRLVKGDDGWTIVE